ncbi:MAG: hypothetical protein AMJ79_02685 [Phycisphaerae bacterium SM23_30]|nr:MAG: hypothetical protein AMJ79_02685 [Phycisphaerae bacterium SM23_30]
MTLADFEAFSDWSEAEYRAEQAHNFYDRGFWDEALRELEAALAANPNNGNWLFNKALTLDTLERYHEAIEVYQQAHEIDPNDPEALNCLAVDYTRVGHYDLALRTFEQIAQRHPDFEPAYCNRIITYSELGQHEKAEEMFYLARQIKEHCPLCYYNIGNSLFSRQLYDRAIWCWQQSRNLDPNHPHIEYRIAQAYWARGERRQAKEYFLAELRRHPGDIEVLVDTGILLLEMEDLPGAREKFNRILELDASYAAAHHYLGEIHLHEGKLPQAVDCFHRALIANPQHQGSHYRLGECFVMLGEIPNAREHLLTEMRFSPDQPEILLDLGCLLDQVGQTTEAMKCFERAIEINPDDPRGYQHLSLCYYLSGLIDQGMDLSVKVLEMDPDHVLALHNLAYAYLRKHNFRAAGEYLTRACRCAPHHCRLKSLKRSIFIMSLAHRAAAPCRRLARWFKSRLSHK